MIMRRRRLLVRRARVFSRHFPKTLGRSFQGRGTENGMALRVCNSLLHSRTAFMRQKSPVLSSRMNPKHFYFPWTLRQFVKDEYRGRQRRNRSPASKHGMKTLGRPYTSIESVKSGTNEFKEMRPTGRTWDESHIPIAEPEWSWLHDNPSSPREASRLPERKSTSSRLWDSPASPREVSRREPRRCSCKKSALICLCRIRSVIEKL